MAVPVKLGDRLPTRTFSVTRLDLVRYAGASGDFNSIHWSDRIARSVDLPGVIAHGMYTMALAGQAVTEWVGDPAALVEFGVRFVRPVLVPDDDRGAEVVVDGVVKKVDADIATVELTVISAGEKVLGQARALVRIEPAVPGGDPVGKGGT
jgi:acyl dehydratase